MHSIFLGSHRLGRAWSITGQCGGHGVREYVSTGGQVKRVVGGGGIVLVS